MNTRFLHALLVQYAYVYSSPYLVSMQSQVGDFGLATSHKSSGHRNNVNTSLDMSEMTQGQLGQVDVDVHMLCCAYVHA